MNNLPLSGVHTALITPFNQGNICYSSLERLLELQILNEVHGIVILGTTAESPTITASERAELIKFIKNHVQNRLHITVGTGAYSTKNTLELTQQAQDLGADAAMVVAPYYNKPSQEGLFQHFSKVAESTSLPILIYSHPGRCGIAVEPHTLQKLRQTHTHICGIKDASGSCEYISTLCQLMDPDFSISAGDDSMTLPYMSLGGHGIISVITNLLPQAMVELYNHAASNDFLSATRLHKQYYNLFKTQSIEPNPVPIKYCLYQMGLISSPEVRLPLCEMSDANQLKANQALETLKDLLLC